MSKFFVRSGVEKYMDYMVQETSIMINETMVPNDVKKLDLQEVRID